LQAVHLSGKVAGPHPEISFHALELLSLKVFASLPGYIAFPTTPAAAGPMAAAPAKKRFYHRALKEA
jgi:hypothetical protein